MTNRIDNGLSASTVLVTGAGGHLGRAICLGLARDGALPVLNGRNRATLDALADELKRAGYESLVVPGDVTDQAAMTAALAHIAKEAKARGRRFDGLVNNAFAGTTEDVATDVPALFAQAAAVNLGAAAYLTETFAALPDAGPRSVVNIASMYGVVSPDPALYPDDMGINPMHYGATKAGLLQLTRTMAVRLATQGVRVNAVVPGPFPNESVQQNHPEFSARLANRTPMKRLGRAEEVYPPIRFLLRADASFVTGASIAVDGGWTAI